MSDVTAVVDRYLAMWNEADAEARSRLIESAWTADGRYEDPVLEASGHAELSTMVTQLQERFPGHRFRRLSGIDAHHESVRFAWDLVGPDGAVAVAGVDHGVLAADGRLAAITGFFGELPEVEGHADPAVA